MDLAQFMELFQLFAGLGVSIAGKGTKTAEELQIAQQFGVLLEKMHAAYIAEVGQPIDLSKLHPIEPIE